jgi:hypothetical protein
MTKPCPVFVPRHVESRADWCDADGVKLYAISATGTPVDPAAYLPHLAEMKRARAVDWPHTPAFALFHDGATLRYLVLCWWGNENELFTVVSVLTATGWVEDAGRFSFCVWDLEVLWHERNAFIAHVYCPTPNLASYRAARLAAESPQSLRTTL